MQYTRLTSMSQNLEFLMAEAKKYTMTEPEREAQVRSFAFGNTHFENDSITREDVDQAAAKLLAERHPTESN